MPAAWPSASDQPANRSRQGRRRDFRRGSRSGGLACLAMVVTAAVLLGGNSLLVTSPDAARWLAALALPLEHGSWLALAAGMALVLVAGAPVEREAPGQWWRCVAGTVVFLVLIHGLRPDLLAGYSGLSAVGHSLLACGLLGGWLIGRWPSLWLAGWAGLVLVTVTSDLWWPAAGAWVTAHCLGVMVGSVVALNDLRRELSGLLQSENG